MRWDGTSHPSAGATLSVRQRDYLKGRTDGMEREEEEELQKNR
jgi:hypothetical protein